MTSNLLSYSSFAAALAADGPAADRAGKMGLYGRFIGSWEMDATVFLDDGTPHRGAGETKGL